jgi:hypothetical protein
MRKLRAVLAVALGAAAVTVVPLSAGAAVPLADTHVTKNLAAVGASARLVPLDNAAPDDGVYNSDLAFWGDTAVQGSYGGIRLVDISDPTDPEEIVNWMQCTSATNTVGNQGDVIVYRDLVFRSWNSATPAPQVNGQNIPTTDPARYTTPGAFCGDWPMFREPAVPAGCTPASACTLPERGQEGVHVIDISDPENPDVIAFVDTPCGSHTATGVPDLANNRFLIYSSPSANTTFGSPDPPTMPISCRGVDIIEVPLDAPEDAFYLRFLPTGAPGTPVDDHHAFHDFGVILGDVNKLGCAGADSLSIFSVDPADGASLEMPMFMHHTEFPGVSIGHSAAFTPDGKYAIFGWEPGGGTQARCQATSALVDRTLYFVEVETGAVAGTFIHPRPQNNVENCTWHNYNVVPTDAGYFLVSGNYQSGTSIVDFTDVANAKEIAYADPAPLVDPNPPVGIESGGAWSSYWYNGYIYESDMVRGIIVWGRQSNDDFRAGQADEKAAFQAQRAAAQTAFDQQQAAAKAAADLVFTQRRIACTGLSDRVARAACLAQLRADEVAFRVQQQAEAAAFKAQQQAARVAFENKQAADKRDFQRVAVALSGARLPYLNPQTQEVTFD